MCYKAAHSTHWGKHHPRHHAKKRRRHHMGHWGYPPANVEELDDRYEIRIFAAGYEKSDFQVGLQDNDLLISVKKSYSEEEQATNERRRGFIPGNFERHFQLNEKIDKNGISAKYEAGILTVALPKREGFETIRQDIDIV